MKKTLLSLALLAVCLFVANSVSAIPIFYSNGMKFKTLHELPDSVEVNGQHVDFGVSFDQFSIMWIPMWNYGELNYAVASDDTVYGLDEEELTYLQEAYGIDTEKAPQIPFWDRIGGKIIWGALALLIIWGIIPGKKDEEEEERPEVPSAWNKESEGSQEEA